MIAADTLPARGPIPAPLATTSSMTLFGTLIWIGPLWVFVFVANLILVGAIGRWAGPLDESTWTYVCASWQRWPVGAAGFTMAVVFLPMLVTNGVTRARLGQSAAVTLAALAVLGGGVVTLGYAIESVVFDAEGWTHVMSDDAGWRVADVGYATIFASFTLVNGAFFVAGWLAATALRRFGWVVFVPFLVVALAPAITVEYLMNNPFGSTQTAIFERLAMPSLWVGIPVSIAVIAATALATARWTRSVDID